MTQQVRLGDLLGSELEDIFADFDLTEIQEVLSALQDEDAIDLSHAERLQQLALRGADILTEYLGKIVKTVGYLETEVNSTKNKVMLEYIAHDLSGNEVKTTADMKKWAGESSPEVKAVQIRLAQAKGSKVYLEKKYDILIKAHHHYKDIAVGIRRSIVGYNSSTTEKIPDGYE